mgnify:CR=1 FL=1
MTKLERLRAVTWRHRMLQRAAAAPRGVAETCRHFGISRKTFYKWKRRFRLEGEAGLSLAVTVGNPAQRVYERLGFRIATTSRVRPATISSTSASVTQKDAVLDAIEQIITRSRACGLTASLLLIAGHMLGAGVVMAFANVYALVRG